MPDLEKQITEWRRQMLAAGIKTPVPLEELESHLREDVERRMKSGASAKEAFDAAVLRIGEAHALKAEFAKVGQSMSARERKLTWMLAGVCVVCDVAMGLAFLFDFVPEPLTFRERMLGAGAWFLFPAILWSWRYTCRYLPVVPGRRKRLAVATLSSVLGGLGTAMLLHLIPAAGSELGPFNVAIAWALFPLVIGATLVFGLEEAAYRKFEPIGS